MKTYVYQCLLPLLSLKDMQLNISQLKYSQAINPSTKNQFLIVQLILMVLKPLL